MISQLSIIIKCCDREIWVSSEEPGNSNNNLNVLTMMLWQLQTEAAELFASRLVRNVRECCTHPRAVTCRTHCGKGLFGNIEWITPPSACLTCAGWAHRFLPIRGPPSSHPLRRSTSRNGLRTPAVHVWPTCGCHRQFNPHSNIAWMRLSGSQPLACNTFHARGHA